MAIDQNGGQSVDAVACPSLSQCTAVDADGQAVTFDPGSPGGAVPASVDAGYGLASVACPSSAQCTAIAGAREVTFDPTSPGAPTPVAIDAGNDVRAVACPSVWQCTAVDNEGNEVTAAPQAPRNSSPPAIAGTAQQDQTLTETHGTWTGSPTTGYTYRWEDCDSAAVNCAPIAGATAPTFTLTASDDNHTIRVMESATNVGGTGGPVSSAATGVVSSGSPAPAPPSDTSPPTIVGTPAEGRTLSETDGTWSGAPTGFAYQWQDCDAAAADCRPIVGATAGDYTLSRGDVGQT
ncbi:MAG: hypothetical protein ABSH51_17690, partial [Solirubrobacteraceae bacterium]